MFGIRYRKGAVCLLLAIPCICFLLILQLDVRHSAGVRNVLANAIVDCDSLREAADETIYQQWQNWTLNTDDIMSVLLESSDICRTFGDLFTFRRLPLSMEEFQFPLAYGILVHDNFVQVMLMLSSFYHPQNEYCIAVSESATPVFKQLCHSLPRCFANVHVINVGRTDWGSYEIIRAVHRCVAYLDALDTDWKYFQYLSGVDIPLRTNLEMVRIFKALNGTFNVEIKAFEKYRLMEKADAIPPLKMYKSSLSSLFSREAAHVIATNTKVLEYLDFLRGTYIADEGFWATVAANPEVVKMPGGFNGSKYMEFREEYQKRAADQLTQPVAYSEHIEPCVTHGYISRYQLWYSKECKGIQVHHSCVFGVRDLPKLLSRAELVAHKLYINYQPAAYICMLKEIERRSLRPSSRFSVRGYLAIPQLELNRGVEYEQLSHPEWM